MEIRQDITYNFDFLGMQDPFRLKNMEIALKRIIKAVNEREKIVIYGNCDLDGVTAVSLLFLVLKYLNADVEYFISDDMDDKLNINSRLIKNHIKFLGAKLILTTGCGSQSISQVELCKKLGMDVIVTDYHKYKGVLPRAVVINPNQRSCNYPFKDLTAVGVAFKLSQAISVYYQMKSVSKYLDLVLLGTLSKGIRVTGENKEIVNQGLYHLNYTNNHGFRALLKVYGIKNINRDSIFKLSNNMRLSTKNKRYIDNARIAVELFITENMDRAEQIAKYLKNEILD
ncbi:delta(24)-sterol C-methyltransferase [Clostridium tyrobutyricum]|jgi:single-stranded DNA-specific DHH superfamily exonuclease|uniref:Single-stranded-DNA-specific exonuclease RecJ, clostridial paralog n=1 Tax=Clostridium tyrobutyricum DIVETGP TaxID=1408889 RepID=W6N2U9_CLOTY|nr:DHH family phosphoesterase [Clostridium tyrobutyricum]AND84167.1 RecJ-like protein [Clostridium tyrobutyricum]ANP68893.1 delta(24)-sterol C-methyltransferase [Clostridium tyrobutyricum]MBR9649108.1 DHH family phosphoesterase [Clostridium tyrobutyricum]MBV4415907.1 DHH family phosphoesterase [Clostridium tyrobutyricum]MBV4421826.1 DHH family phosphoesterase [Clostridium tyrobutyricum]